MSEIRRVIVEWAETITYHAEIDVDLDKVRAAGYEPGEDDGWDGVDEWIQDGAEDTQLSQKRTEVHYDTEWTTTQVTDAANA